MSSPGAADAARFCVLIASLLASRVALADAAKTCRDAFYQTQVLRDEGKLQEAIEQAKVCERTCGDELGGTCARWKVDLEARFTSTVVLEVVDAAGQPVTNVVVSLDGVPWLDRIDGSPQTIAKGQHTLAIAVPGAPRQERSIVVREGEKGRRIRFSVTRQPAEDGAAPAHRVGPWIVGGVGLGALVAGAVTGGLTVHEHDVMIDQCDEARGTCSQEGLDASARGQILGPATTGLLIAGGALVGAAVIWLVVAPSADDPSTVSLRLEPTVASDGATLLLGGAW